MELANQRIYLEINSFDLTKPIVQMNQGSSFTKINSQAKLDNFAFQNSNIIIEGLI